MIDFGEILDKLKRGKGNLTDKEAFLLLNKGKDRLSEEEIFDLECIVAKDALDSYIYSKNSLKGRFSLGEAIIAISDFSYSYMYATNVIRGRFRLGEKRPIKYSEYLGVVCKPLS